MSSLREPQSSSSPFLSSCALQSYEHGVNTFDTANIYSNGVSEVYLGRAIKALNLPREEIVVMTKVCD
jgi:aryl-alcohol dehydrogenase-like predicted oxidoreductase